MPPSRPVSARRSGNNDEPEKAVLHTYLLPRNLAEAKSRSRAALAEVLGSILVTTALLACGIAALVLWLSTYAIPFGTYMRASCLVLNSTQTMLPEGFNREPLYRAEVYVYVFNTTYPECCCEDLFGRQRCAEWEGVAFDNMQNTHTAGDKWDFLRLYGYPGTFHKCWHSPSKERVLLARDTNTLFLLLPILLFFFGAWGVLSSARKVASFKAAQYYIDKFSGKVADENPVEGQPLRPKRLVQETDDQEDDIPEDDPAEGNEAGSGPLPPEPSTEP
mmetsp:Transcript_28151/g.65535  ORF Transcript_28151/g.65535 Transcript_28151/m.65535 type:complete len:276 (+) Transcript_28151:39-866(+)